MSDFAKISELVTQGQQLLDSIKGGAIRTMQTQFDALKKTITTDGEKVVSDVDSLGRNKLQQLDSELARVKQSVDINALGGEARYVTEITVSGDKDTFYPVYFILPTGDETDIQVFRHYSWNSKNSGAEAGDFDATHVASALVVLKGQAYAWNGDANYLRTVVNYQRYRQCVSNISHRGYVEQMKNSPTGPDSSYNSQREGYLACRHSSFMLRGGNLKYQIISNKPITFSLKGENELVDSQGGTLNYKWLAKALPLSEIENGDGNNNHPTTYISYATPEVSA
ncbi:Phage tail protein [Vibrio crassostreae]|nr:Phage tail protein [Vibrio crassostreae]